MRVFLLLLASSMSLVSFLGGYSAFLIVGDEDNIDVDVDTSGNLFGTDVVIDINFEINNVGYYDIEDIEIELVLRLEYDYENCPVIGGRTFKNYPITIFEGSKDLGDAEAGKVFKDSLTITREDLIQTVNFTKIAFTLDISRNPVVSFIATSIIIDAKYSLGLIDFNIELEDYYLGGIDPFTVIPP